VRNSQPNSKAWRDSGQEEITRHTQIERQKKFVPTDKKEEVDRAKRNQIKSIEEEEESSP